MEESSVLIDDFKNPMHVAVLKGDVKAIVALKKSRVRVNGMENGMTPLHLAVVKGDALIVKKLISLGANLLKMNKDGFTPLHLAVVFNRITLFDDLIGTDYIDTFNSDGNSALHMAVIKANANAVTALIEFGADADMPNKKGHAPLHIAIILGNADVIDAVIEYADKPNILDNTESRPLHLAVMHNQPDTIRKIGELDNTKVNYLNGFGDSPLHLAAKLGNVQVIEELYHLGANVNLKNSKGLAAIHIAVIFNKLSAVQALLLQCRAHIDCADKDGNTPIHWAVTQNRIFALRLFCELSANVDIRNALGDSPLHTAILADNRKALKVLLHYGADFDILNAKGMTPLHIAACFGNKYVMVKLIRVGASVHSIDANGDRPLHSAAKFCNSVGIETMVKCLANLASKNGDGLTALDIILSYVKKNTFKTAVETLTDIYKKFNLKRNSPLCLQEILICAKMTIKYEIFKNLEHSKLNEPEYVADIIPSMLSYINDSLAEVKLMKSTLLHENFPFYSFVMSGWVAKMPLTRAYTSEVVLDHVLDVATTKGYPVYRNLIISRLERPALLKKVSYLKMFARLNGKATFLDLDAVPLIAKHLGNNDIFNLLLAYSDLDQDDGVSNSSNGNKRKLAETQLVSQQLSVHQSAKKSRSSLVNTFVRASSSIITRSKKALWSETTIGKKAQFPEAKSQKCLVKTSEENSISKIAKLSEAKKRTSPWIKTTNGNHSPLSPKVTEKNYSSSTDKTTKEKQCALSTRSKTRSLNSKATRRISNSKKSKK